MRPFEKLMPFLVLGLMIGAAVVLYLAIRTERQLAARKQINLINYRQKNHLFYITRDIPVAVVAGALALAALVLAIIALTNPVVRLYAIPLALLMGVNGICAYFAIARKKFTRDIRVFDAYYVQVADLLANKERTQQDIEICQKRVFELRQKLGKTIKWFNQNLTEPVAEGFLPSLFAPVNEMLQDYTREIEWFSGAIEADFNKAISAFLIDAIEPELHVVPLRDFDETAADDLIAAIKASYGAQVAKIAQDQMASGAVKNARALANIMSLLNELGVTVDKETLGNCLRVAAQFDDRTQLAEVLYKNKQIPAALVRETFIPEQMDWAFADGMAQAFNTRELTAILTDLLAADRVAMSYTLLSQFDATLMPVLREAMQAEEQRSKQPNAAAKQAKAFALVLGNEYAVGNAASIFESIALMLFDHRTECGFDEEEQARIVEIVQANNYLEARREIGVLYNKAVQKNKPLAESAMRVVLQYVVNATPEQSIFDNKRLVALLGEYRFTVSVGDLAVMRDLVAAWLLCTTKDEAVYQTVLQELINVPAQLPTPEPPTKENGRAYGRLILTHMSKHERVRLRSVIYRTESERLALDRVLAIVAKEG